MTIINAFTSIFSIVIMIAAGVILSWKKWLNKDVSKVFSKLVTNLALPCLMISDLMTNFTKDKLDHLGKGLIIPFSSMLLGYITAIILSKVIGVKKGRRGTFLSMFFISNSIFIGLPVNLALFGNSSIPYVLLYYIANTSFFWTIGAYGISKDGAYISGTTSASKGFFNRETLRRIMSPPLMGFISALLMIMLGIKLPKFILDTCKYFGNMTTPLSMLFIGITIYNADLKKIKLNKEMIVLLLGRFAVSPLLALLLAWHYPIPVLMKKVFVIQSAMPVMTNTAIVARSYGADYEYATVMTVLTTILSFITIPLYMALINVVLH